MASDMLDTYDVAIINNSGGFSHIGDDAARHNMDGNLEGSLGRDNRESNRSSDTDSSCSPHVPGVMLYDACKAGDYDRAKEILYSHENAHDPSITSYGYSALHIAAENGHHKIVKLLTSFGVDVNVKTAPGGYTALHLAASAGHVLCVKTLLEHDEIDVDVVDSSGKTPLQSAARNSDAAKALLHYGKTYCTSVADTDKPLTKYKLVVYKERPKFLNSLKGSKFC